MWLVHVWDHHLYYTCGHISYVRIWSFRRTKLLKWGDDFNLIVVFSVRRVLNFSIALCMMLFFYVKAVFEWFWSRTGIYIEDDLFFVHFSDVTDSKALIDDHKIEVHTVYISYSAFKDFNSNIEQISTCVCLLSRNYFCVHNFCSYEYTGHPTSLAICNWPVM